MTTRAWPYMFTHRTWRRADSKGSQRLSGHGVHPFQCPITHRGYLVGCSLAGVFCRCPCRGGCQLNRPRSQQLLEHSTPPPPQTPATRPVSCNRKKCSFTSIANSMKFILPTHRSLPRCPAVYCCGSQTLDKGAAWISSYTGLPP